MNNSDSKFNTKPQPNCPVCYSEKRTIKFFNATDINHGTVPGEWTFWQCSNCTSLYLDPRLRDEDLVNAYSEYETHSNPISLDSRVAHVGLWQAIKLGYLWLRYNYKPGKKYWLAGWLMYFTPPYIRAEWDTYMMHIPKYKPGGRILDIGCGSGGFLLRAKACGWDVMGVDFDRASVQIANDNGINVLHGSIDVLDEHEKFDVITMSHVIEHVANPNDFIDHAWRHINPNGFLQILTPNNLGLGLAKWKNGWSTLDTPRHLVILNTSSIIQLTSKLNPRNLRIRLRGWHLIHTNAQSRIKNKCSIDKTTLINILKWHAMEMYTTLRKSRADELFLELTK